MTSTRETWPDETPEQVIARVRAEHGDAIAEVVARSLTATPNRKNRVPTVVGATRVRRMALTQGLVPKQGVAWDEGGTPFGTFPRSGAGAVVQVVPRAHARRRGMEDG